MKRKLTWQLWQSTKDGTWFWWATDDSRPGHAFLVNVERVRRYMVALSLWLSRRQLEIGEPSADLKYHRRVKRYHWLTTEVGRKRLFSV